MTEKDLARLNPANGMSAEEAIDLTEE